MKPGTAFAILVVPSTGLMMADVKEKNLSYWSVEGMLSKRSVKAQQAFCVLMIH